MFTNICLVYSAPNNREGFCKLLLVTVDISNKICLNSSVYSTENVSRYILNLINTMIAMAYVSAIIFDNLFSLNTNNLVTKNKLLLGNFFIITCNLL